MKKDQLRNFTCGTCIGLNSRKLIPGAKTPCEGLGHIATSKACPLYKPDVYFLTDLNEVSSEQDYDVLGNLSKCLGKMSDTECTLIAGILLSNAATRKLGFNFWQKVYFKLGGTEIDDYLDCYVPCRVIDATKKTIRLIGERKTPSTNGYITGKVIVEVSIASEGSLGSRKQYKCSKCTPKGCPVCKSNQMAARTNILTLEQYAAKRQELISLKKLKCPVTRNKSSFAPLSMPTIDYAVTISEITEEATGKNKKVKISKNQDLVAIVGKMSRGVILKREDASYQLKETAKPKRKSGSVEITISHD